MINKLKVLLNDIKEDPNKRRQEIYHNKDINYPKLIYVFTQISITIPTRLFEELDKMIRKNYIIKIQD